MQLGHSGSQSIAGSGMVLWLDRLQGHHQLHLLPQSHASKNQDFSRRRISPIKRAGVCVDQAPAARSSQPEEDVALRRTATKCQGLAPPGLSMGRRGLSPGLKV